MIVNKYIIYGIYTCCILCSITAESVDDRTAANSTKASSTETKQAANVTKQQPPAKDVKLTGVVVVNGTADQKQNTTGTVNSRVDFVNLNASRLLMSQLGEVMKELNESMVTMCGHGSPNYTDSNYTDTGSNDTSWWSSYVEYAARTIKDYDTNGIDYNPIKFVHCSLMRIVLLVDIFIGMLTFIHINYIITACLIVYSVICTYVIHKLKKDSTLSISEITMDHFHQVRPRHSRRQSESVKNIIKV